MDDLERFLQAQDGGVYERALGEVRRGRKASHWMWFVLPQLAGLGRSSTAEFYAIRSLDHARAYLEHPVLGRRLREITTVVADLDADPETVFGAVDALKLRSSVTLFHRADPAEPAFAAVLEKHYHGVPDPATDNLLAGG